MFYLAKIFLIKKLSQTFRNFELLIKISLKVIKIHKNTYKPMKIIENFLFKLFKKNLKFKISKITKKST